MGTLLKKCIDYRLSHNFLLWATQAMVFEKCWTSAIALGKKVDPCGRKHFERHFERAKAFSAPHF